MEKQDIKKIERIIVGLVIRNMRAGSSYKKAKEQAFNRMWKDYPKILNVWLSFKS